MVSLLYQARSSHAGDSHELRCALKTLAASGDLAGQLVSHGIMRVKGQKELVEG